MTPDRWARVKEIFNSALERDEKDRPAFLAHACGSDEDLRREVESLLREHSPTAVIESPVRPPDLSGRTITHYRILQKLGAGGMGVVYKAEDTKLGRTVALKFLPPRASASEEHKARFVREAKAAAAIDHPNICTVYEIEEADGQTFLAMTFVDGQTLKEKIAERPLKLEEALRIAIEAAQGLQAAHRKGIVHRDVKSTNLMLDAEGRVVITDFGLAHLEGETRITQTGATMGTPACMSPEQVKGEEVDHRTDIWSLGVVLYEMVTGRLPFEADHYQALALAIQSDDPEPLTALRSGVPRQLDWIVAKMLAKSPDERYQSADELVVDLRAVGRKLEAGGYAGRPGRRRIPWWAAAGVALIAVGAWLFVFRGSKPEAPMRVVPLTSYPSLEFSPTFSPDGSQVAFALKEGPGGGVDIYVKMIGDVRRMRLTNDPRHDIFPAWSPDGHRIAFVRRLLPDKLGVFVVSPLGGPDRKLAEIEAPIGEEHFCRPAWSLDGRFLAVSDRDAATQRYRLWLLSVETREKTALTEPPERFRGDRDPAFSPDGRTLAFVRETTYLSDVYLLPLSEDYTPVGEPKRLTFDNRINLGAAWTPDGREVIFTSGDSLLALWRIAASGAGRARRLELVGEDARWPVVSADGRRLAYTRIDVSENIWRIERSPSTAEWRPPENFSAISSTRRDSDASFSPDGRRIAFVSDRSGSVDIWVCERDGSNAVPLASMSPHAGALRWSPDGERLLFDSVAAGDWDVYVVGAEGGKPRRLTAGPSDEGGAAWSRDGRWIYFNSNRGSDFEVWKMPAEGGDAVQVTRNGGYVASESADGRTLYYTKNSWISPLYKLPLSGGEESRVLESVYMHAFVVTREGIYFIAGPDEGAASVQFFDFASGQSKPIARIEVALGFYLSVSPDGRTILYTQCDQIGSDLMLLENFR